MKQNILTLVFFTIVTLSGFSQNTKLEEKASELVAKLNTEIMAGDQTQALTETQQSEIKAIHIERLIELRKAKKEGANKELNKDINKKYFQRIFKEVLISGQIKARAKGKKTED